MRIETAAVLLSFVAACGWDAEDAPAPIASGGAGGGSGASAGSAGQGGAAPLCPGAPEAGPSPDPGTLTGRVDVGRDQAIDRDAEYDDGSEVLYLSGRGIDDALDWQFMVTGGRNSCVWSTLPVPSHWEFHGFGTLRYGSEPRTNEQGSYRRSFSIPAGWDGKRIALVFEGSMTDTEVTVNGRTAGAVHQGAFYRFEYDVSDLLKPGERNELEVRVAKESSNPSVNEAERQADYWVFGGIFRPVFLEARPTAFVERIAIDAKADGAFAVDVFLEGVTAEAILTARVFDQDMNPVGAPISGTVARGATQTRLQAEFDGISSWSAETPSRYRASVELDANGAKHAVRTNFGFRTLEVRAGDGIYVNGTRIMFRGVNRHAFWPESGRALSERLSLADVQVLKELNVNAVRNSHYPVDRHFLDYADAYGFWVLDELAGWQSPPYDEEVGRKLVEEMVTFDVNHPSVLFWNNGNEGGWNTALDADFGRWDPQARPVLHPWATFSNVNTDHYESYASTSAILARSTIFMPTEFLHGLFDGGAGAGLEDYWNAMLSSPVGAGGFLWAFLDEGVRLDNGSIDVKGNAAPDGIVGPYREREGSFYAVRQIWSPVQIGMTALPDGFDGAIDVRNAYDFTDLATVTFDWQLVTFDVGSPDAGHAVVAEGTSSTAGIPPHASGTLELELPANFWDAHALLLDAHDANGTLVGHWSWMLRSHAETRASIVDAESTTAATATDDANNVIVLAGSTEFTFSKTSGQLASVRVDGVPYPFANGPSLSVGTSTLETFDFSTEGSDVVVTATYSGELAEVSYRVHGNGWLRLDYRYVLAGTYEHFGVDFDAPEADVLRVQWLGRGPYRVWRNRMQGSNYDVWQRDRNDTFTGHDWNYPEFKGYFADVYWVRVVTEQGPMLIVVDTPDVFLRLYTPANGSTPQATSAAFPAKDISFLHGISAVGDKFLSAAALGPQGEPHQLDDDTFSATLYLRFGEP